MAPDFEKRECWSRRFASESAFEWLASSEQVIEILEPYLICLPPDAPILQLGFGTSDLQIHLRKRGFVSITNVDYEPLAIERGQARENAAFGDIRLSYLVADATQLNLDRTFALVLDKSTADAIACGGELAFLSMAEGVRKHLADGVCWISISYSAYRFDVASLPFEVEIISKTPTKKLKQTDPDIFSYCYLLRANEPVISTEREAARSKPFISNLTRHRGPILASQVSPRIQTVDALVWVTPLRTSPPAYLFYLGAESPSSSFSCVPRSQEWNQMRRGRIQVLFHAIAMLHWPWLRDRAHHVCGEWPR